MMVICVLVLVQSNVERMKRCVPEEKIKMDVTIQIFANLQEQVTEKFSLIFFKQKKIIIPYSFS